MAGEPPDWADDDDPHVAAYAEYLRTLAAHKELADTPWLAISAAREIAGQDDIRSWELRARVLANQPIEEIADRFGVSLATIAWFETLFYDVRVRLNASAWIRHVTTGDGFFYGFRDDKLGALWAFFAYHGGPIVLDAMVTAFYRAWRPGEPATISVYLRDDCPASLSMKAVIAAYAVPVNEETDRKFMEIHARLQAIKARFKCGRFPGRLLDELKRETIALWRSTASKPADTRLLSPKAALIEQAARGQKIQFPDAVDGDVERGQLATTAA